MKLQTWFYISNKGISPSPWRFWNEIKLISYYSCVFSIGDPKLEKATVWKLKSVERFKDDRQNNWKCTCALCWLFQLYCASQCTHCFWKQPKIPSHLRFGSKQLSVWYIKTFEHTTVPLGQSLGYSQREEWMIIHQGWLSMKTRQGWRATPESHRQSTQMTLSAEDPIIYLKLKNISEWWIILTEYLKGVLNTFASIMMNRMGNISDRGRYYQ